MPEIIVIGDSTLDTFIEIDNATLSYEKKSHRPSKLCLDYAQKIAIMHSTQSLGGNAANVSVALSKLGFDVELMSELGDDFNGHVILEELEKAGVGTEYVKCKKGSQTRYSAILNYQSERTVLSYHVKRKYTFARLPESPYIYYTSLGEGSEKMQNKLVEYLTKHPETKLIFNPGSYQIEHEMKSIRNLLRHIDIIFVNKEEAEKILGQKNTVKNLLKGFSKQGVKTVVITDGSEGSYCLYENTFWYMPCFKANAIAKTGAGDAYASGFTAAFMLEKDIAQCMRWGSANAASVVQEFGAQNGILSRRQMQKFLKTFSQKPKTVS